MATQEHPLQKKAFPRLEETSLGPSRREQGNPDLQEFKSTPSWSDAPIRFEQKIGRNENGGDVPVPGTQHAILWEGSLESDGNSMYRYIMFQDDKKRFDAARGAAAKKDAADPRYGAPRNAKYPGYIPPPDGKGPNIHWYGRLQESRKNNDGKWSSWSELGEAEDLGTQMDKNISERIRKISFANLKLMRGTPETRH
ncbi:MAG: hypothetical protein Q8P49_03050 [Candidatus Liptonbacteria bacterium]|nr:hypothetical protein [Candidatus Liptonbacteria bacterium]